jgi:hypothetical protein
MQDPTKFEGKFQQELLITAGCVGDTESDPKSDILGQANLEIRTDHCLDFRA